MSSTGIATQPDSSLVKIMEKIMVDSTYKVVLRTLAQRKSMAFWELTSACDIREEKLVEIINDLENSDVVKVLDSGDTSEEIVTLRHKGFGIASSLENI